MRRRDLFVLAGAAALLPFAARAQRSEHTYRIAYLGPSPASAPPQRAFVAALNKLGFVEGKNLAIDTRGSGQSPGQYEQVARELAAAKPDVIVCGGPEPARAARAATATIPILVNTDDIVGEGLVKSIARPEANITGISIHSPDLDGKRFEILLELLPGARRIDALAGADTANDKHFAALQDAARARGVALTIRTADSYAAIGPAIEAAKNTGAQGLNVLGSALLFGNRRVIFERTAALRLPAIYQWPENADEGGLIGYGPSITRIYAEQISRLAVKLMQGAKPGDLPVELPDKFDMAINQKVAKALDLAVPSLLLAQADEVIE
ncbi:MAG TPA: ABC transporter substrate-binding protein [Stellaceae bacterium]|nr:ABC transporter substrate-binding protein [Stellaceae bacterium]